MRGDPGPGEGDGRRSLPVGLTSFVGRIDELGKLESLLARHRMVTVIGPGGSGKTRLALEAARRLAGRFEAGAALVELAPLEDPGLVASAAARALGVAEHRSLSVLDAVAATVGRRHLLLVVDNCEHVIDAAAQLCQQLLTAGDDLRVLATSREALGVSGEVRFALGPLPVPTSREDRSRIEDGDAVTLFMERAGRADAAFALTPDSQGAVATIVERLDGLPLAIELAAAQLDAMSLDELVTGLEDRFAILVGQTRGVTGRLASLEASVEWSYRLLNDPERRTFRHLSVFPAPFTVAAAGAAAGPDTARVVSRLVRRSMLGVPRPAPDGQSRYAMLETLRAFGQERLEEAGVVERAGHDQAAKSYSLFRAVLNTAVADELLVRNPCQIRGAGQYGAPERPFVPTEVVLQLADAIVAVDKSKNKTGSTRLRALLLLAGFAGLRPGELVALRRNDIDLLHQLVAIDENAPEVGGKRTIGPPKSEAGKREVAIPGPIMCDLETHLDRFVAPEAEAWVFTGPRGAPIGENYLSVHFRKAVAAVPGAPRGLRVYDLRHHAATLTAQVPGVTTKELMARIGHSSPRAALIYQHATAERDKRIADAMGEAITKAATQSTVVTFGVPGVSKRRTRVLPSEP